MSSNHPDPPRPPERTPQEIPLQDLPSTPAYPTGNGHDRRRGSSGRGRNLLRRGRDDVPGPPSRYERVAANSPTPQGRTYATSGPRIITPFDTTASPYAGDDAAPVSPVEDLSGFQQALGGFAGLTFQGEETHAPAPTRPRWPTRTTTEPVIVVDDTSGPSYAPSQQPPARRNSDDSQYYFSPVDHADSDTTPLTNPRHLQPISGAMDAAASDQSGERLSFQDVRFSTSGSPGARLGDDLPFVEAGYGRARGRSDASSQRKRSLSSGGGSISPLTRAGSMMRNMSQRVVNLSNEPDVVEQSIRRKPSQAVLTEPPSFPAMMEYAHDARTSSEPPRPVEKDPPLRVAGVGAEPWPDLPETNPLMGKTLGIFDRDNPLRLRLCDLLVHPATEPTILVLIVIQTILLAIESAPSVYTHPRPKRWHSDSHASWIDLALLGLFTIYSLEIVVRIIVSGFVMNAPEYSTVDQKSGFRTAVVEKTRSIFSLQRQPSRKGLANAVEPSQHSIIRSFTGIHSQAQQETRGHTRQQQRIRLARRAFLRHSFNRLDFVAVVSFWISFVLAILGLEWEMRIYVFRMLSCLRILRLLGLTRGTSVILRSLKKAAPLLANVTFLIGFFWLLFAIVGVQSFKSSYRRSCVFFDPDSNAALPNYTQQFQFCGGHLNAVNGKPERYLSLHPDPNDLAQPPKGYLCPRQSRCVEQDRVGLRPFNGTISFDNILQSLELVFVVMSSNTYADLMYYTTQSDYLAAALFFAAGFVIMSLFLINLLVAVIISSFQVIREESATSAFTAHVDEVEPESDDEIAPPRVGAIKKAFDKTRWLWLLIIVYGLGVQCLRSADMSEQKRLFIDVSESVVTFALLLEIFLRFGTDWRNFHRSKRNWVDLALAIVTTVIQIPVIRNSGQPYAWLTGFQILRSYRLVLAVSVTRDLIMVVLGNVSGVLNLMVFVFLITFLTAIFAVQLFREEIPQIDSNTFSIRVNFSNIYNSFIGMYQIFSSENWTTILYNITSFEQSFGTGWIGASFVILWFILANFIVLNMFIAVIQENFDVTEDEKRIEQVKAFLQRKDLGATAGPNLSLSSIFQLGRTRHQKDPLDYGPATMEMLLKDAVVQEFLDEQAEQLGQARPINDTPEPMPVRPKAVERSLTTMWDRTISFYRDREVNPFYSDLTFEHGQEELDPRVMAKAVVDATERRKRAQREYLLKHPTYNNSLFFFKPTNPIRKFCQKIVAPGRGPQRYQGVEPVRGVYLAFSAFIYAAVLVMVILACITTPLYQKEYFEKHDFSVRNWFVFTDMGFAVLFLIEAVVKVIADGFFWTPNAYFRSSWGLIDGLVLVTLWVNVGTSLYSEGAVSRAVGAFKALRALRLLNFSDSARDTFRSVIILGGWKVISAAFVSLSLIFPFAIYGLNLFNGQFSQCNDNTPNQSQIRNLTADCVGEYANQPYNNGWQVLQPRANLNLNYFSFDDFRSSLFLLFQIVSQEGWTDVRWQSEMTTGRGSQPQPNAAPGNAMFFVIFNLLGSVFVLTLFISVFMRNYTEQTGVAFLTADQRSWLELRKLLRQISPSKRPSNKPHQKWRNWCYRQAVKKHGKWQRFVTFALVLHLVLLILEYYPEDQTWASIRDYLFLALTVFYIANIIIRIVGLTWTRFRKSSWDLYSVFAVSGVLITTVLLLSNFHQRVYIQLHKLFLVSIALLIIPRNNQLDQLFKTAAASLAALGNLLATWFVLFLVYAIALTQTFGLTRFGPMENANLNVRNVPKALILLFRCSTGESWKQIMEDFAHISEPFCVSDSNFFFSDCGSAAWARVLFCSWNILSMYIFVSLFVSLIFESFSYVYQRSSGLSAVSREEIRRFKQAWATFDPEGTGYIAKDVFPRLLGELSGVFAMRIYDGEHSVGAMLEASRQDHPNQPTASAVAGPRLTVDGIDLRRLAERINRIPVMEIRRRRRVLNSFYEEVMVSADPDRGISFTSVLMILAHYNVITDTKSLRLEEFLRRRARLKRVAEAVHRHIVIGFFDTMYWSRWRRRNIESRESARMQTVPSFGVPEIFVEDEDDRPPAGGAASSSSSSSSPLHSRSRANTDDSAVSAHSPWRSFAQHPPAITTTTTTTSASGIDIDTGSPRSNLRNRAESRPPSPGIPSPDGGRSPHQRSSPSRPSFNLPRSSGSAGYSENYDWPPPLNISSSSRTHLDVHGMARSPAHSRAGSSTEVSAQDVLQVLDNSLWGESIRRSFTGRRPSHRRGGSGFGGGGSFGGSARRSGSGGERPQRGPDTRL